MVWNQTCYKTSRVVQERDYGTCVHNSDIHRDISYSEAFTFKSNYITTNLDIWWVCLKETQGFSPGISPLLFERFSRLPVIVSKLIDNWIHLLVWLLKSIHTDGVSMQTPFQ